MVLNKRDCKDMGWAHVARIGRGEGLVLVEMNARVATENRRKLFPADKLI
jgi:hypothetical protein